MEIILLKVESVGIYEMVRGISHRLLVFSSGYA